MRAAALLLALTTTAPLQDEGDPAAEARRLLEVATEGSPRIRSQASLRLAAMGEDGAAVVRERLEAESGYLSLGPALYEALAAFEGERMRVALWESLDDVMNPWRPAGARALAKTAKMEEQPRFQALLTDRISAVRAEAVAGVAVGDEARAKEALRASLIDQNGRVRRRAATALAKLGEHAALAWLIEDLRRDDSWLDMRLGRIARAEAAQALGEILGREAIAGYSSRSAPDSAEAQAKIQALEARCRELAGDDWPVLPDIARAPGEIQGEVIGVELLSCREGELLLRWTTDDKLVVGEGDTDIRDLPEGSTALLLERAQEALEVLGNTRAYGDPGCDLERHHFRLPGASRAWTIQLSKGPEAVPDLRPAALHPVAEAMIQSAGAAGLEQGWEEQIRRTFESLGGPLSE